MKYSGNIGFCSTEETSPSVYEEVITARHYKGDLVKTSRSLSSSNNVNDDVNISISVSIVMDKYAYENFMNIRWVQWMGSKWKVTNIDASERPRLVLTIGGVYNEQTT